VYITDWTAPDGDGHEHLDDIYDGGFYESNDDSDNHDNNTATLDDHYENGDGGNDDDKDNLNPYDEVDLDEDNDDVDLNQDADLNQNSVYDSNVNNSQNQAQDVDDTSDMGSGANDCSSGKFFSFIVTILWLAIYCT